MQTTTYRGIEIRTEKNRPNEVWLQTQTEKAAKAYAEATGEVVMSHWHTIGWIEATVDEIKGQIDEMLGEEEETVLAADEWASDVNDEGLGMAEAMEWASELDRASRIETTDRPLYRSLSDIMVEKSLHQPKCYSGLWQMDVTVAGAAALNSSTPPAGQPPTRAHTHEETQDDYRDDLLFRSRWQAIG